MLGYVGCKLGHFGRAKKNQTKAVRLRFVLGAMLGQCWTFVKHFGRDKWLRKGILGDFGSYVGPLFGTLGGTNGCAMAFWVILVAMLGLC